MAHHGGGCSPLNGATTVLVLDLSGFTSTTRTFGIIHMASLILRMRQVVLPIVHAHGAVSVFTEADNVFAAFARPEDGLEAALSMRRAIAAANKVVPDTHKHFRMRVGGIGLATGNDIMAAGEDHLYGHTVNVAFRLGEDIAADQILISDEMRQALPLVAVERLTTPTAYAAVVGECYWSVSLDVLQGSDGDIVCPSFDDDAYIGDNAVELTKRFEVMLKPDQLSSLDAKISAKYFATAVIVMFALDTDGVTMRRGVQASVLLEQEVLQKMSAELRLCGGVAMEDRMYSFPRVNAALIGSARAKAAVLEHNASAEPCNVLELCGIGIHSSDLLVIPGTNVHWGDAVNTSSKLGEDIADNGDILISEEAWALHSLPHDAIQWRPQQHEISNVVLPCRVVTIPTACDEKWLQLSQQ